MSNAQVTKEMIEHYKELSEIMKTFRQTLGPKKEAIFNSIMSSVDMVEVFELIEVSGGESITLSGEFEGQPVSVMFRLKKGSDAATE